MDLPRMTARQWILVIAAVVLACTAAVLMQRRDRYLRLAREHSGAFPPISVVDLSTVPQGQRDHLARWARGVAAWHARMSQRYQYAASHPWVSVKAEPAPPKP